jgi:hypothetical protein
MRRIALANENAGEETPVPEQRDTVVMARDYLKKHPEACRNHSSHGGTNEKSAQADGRGGKTHDHGSVTCVAAFLGEPPQMIPDPRNASIHNGLTFSVTGKQTSCRRKLLDYASKRQF